MIIIRSGDKSATDLQNQILVDWPIGGKFRNPTVGLDRCVCLPLRPSQKLFRGLPHGGFELALSELGTLDSGRSSNLPFQLDLLKCLDPSPLIRDGLER
jgi:hypothetical protein